MPPSPGRGRKPGSRPAFGFEVEGVSTLLNVAVDDAEDELLKPGVHLSESDTKATRPTGQISVRVAPRDDGFTVHGLRPPGRNMDCLLYTSRCV